MEPLLPFTPTEAERQHPLAQQYLKDAGHLATASLQPDPNARGPPGSKCGVKEVNAVRAIPLIDLDPKRIVPEQYFPGDGNPIFVSLRKSIRAAKIDDLKSLGDEQFSGNPFEFFFEDLAELITAYNSEESINKAHQRKTSASSISTELSTSSNEGKRETVSTSALKHFVKGTLKKMGDYKRLTTKGPNGPSLKCFVAENRFLWDMAGATHEVVNDGSIGVNSRGSFSGSDRSSEVPVVSLECKPRDVGGIKRSSGEREVFVPTVFAQEVAESIGSMVAQKFSLLLKHSDQESFVVSMHGTLFYISTAYFTPEYIKYIETSRYREADVDGVFLWVRRSVHFDLKDVEQRVQALGFLWALISYVTSANAKINIVTAAIDAAGD